MSISEAQRRHLKKLAHHLKPVVIVGNAGLSENVINEIDEALEHHELIKVRINAGDKKERETLIEEISGKTGSNWVVSIGHVAGFYRQAENIKLILPKD
jgi:RNA-binding protein